MRRIISLPLRLIVALKLRSLQFALDMAQEQTRDAHALHCKACPAQAEGCGRPDECKLARLKDRETVLAQAIVTAQHRLNNLAGS
ncbi:hypothetical protein MFKK_30180 [Halopseudomonas aestusnigri]|uniref:hypothetical protein n=1 Tax=Halopseudomonas TaxID=2901189 RepID=UPI0022B60D2B|nr:MULTISPECIES: hypothetical protein [Halopseudomonas]BDX20208.1 hypothetical protein MFKK_30180 [Halopseudomonas aestusnigri]